MNLPPLPAMSKDGDREDADRAVSTEPKSRETSDHEVDGDGGDLENAVGVVNKSRLMTQTRNHGTPNKRMDQMNGIIVAVLHGHWAECSDEDTILAWEFLPPCCCCEKVIFSSGWRDSRRAKCHCSVTTSKIPPFPTPPNSGHGTMWIAVRACASLKRSTTGCCGLSGRSRLSRCHSRCSSISKDRLAP